MSVASCEKCALYEPINPWRILQRDFDKIDILKRELFSFKSDYQFQIDFNLIIFEKQRKLRSLQS